MKKTLAAVLAAMMALSTATVALAKDTDLDDNFKLDEDLVISEIKDGGVLDTIGYGEKAAYSLKVGDYNITDLGYALDNKLVKIDVTVTEGRSLLKAAPSVQKYAIKGIDNGYAAVLKFEVKHTYNTDLNVKDTDIEMRVRVTALKDCDILGLKKGDTYSIDEIKFAAYYNELTAYGKDMTITADEVVTADSEPSWVVLDASKLVEELEERDTDTATFYFGDTAAFTAKISEAQKDRNLYYETKVADAYYDEYPEVDFEAIQFLASPKFLRKGTLTFNAIGDADTAVYKVTAEGLEELEIAEYDSTYDVVTVEGIDTLTSYLVASEALEVEAEVEVEVEVKEENPNTGVDI